MAYHCLWSLGFQDTDTRVLAHSVFGCAVYGAFAAKVTIVRSKGLPGLALPVAGATMFALFVLAWYTSGQVGPRLDGMSLSASDIEAIVREGRGGMPAFGGELTDAEISAVAAFVAGSR